MARQTYATFQVLPIHFGYPLSWMERKDQYDSKKVAFVKKRSESSIGIHYWHHGTADSKTPILINSTHPLYILMKQNCPVTEKEYLRNAIGTKYAYEIS